jgi:Uma2 family endonuclease
LETQRHRDQMNLLIDSLDDTWRDRTDFYVGGNMFFYFSETQAKHNDFRGPDVFVVLDCVKKERKSWVVWEEDGRRPDVIIELTSPSTEKVDREDKARLYSRVLNIPEYFIFDPFSARLEGFVLDSSGVSYRALQPDERGWVRCARLGLWLGAVPGTFRDTHTSWLRWIDDAGRVLLHPRERAEAEAERAHAETERANAETERANAETERANAETERANAETERANAETQRANTEARRATELAAQLEAYERRFGKVD